MTPVVVILDCPIDEFGAPLTQVAIRHPRLGKHVREFAAADTPDEGAALNVQALCDLAMGTTDRMDGWDIGKVWQAIQQQQGKTTGVPVWPYKLRTALPGLTAVAQPRRALGADMRRVAAAGDHPDLRLLLYVECLCTNAAGGAALTPEQLDAMDAHDVENLMRGVLPFCPWSRPVKPPTTSSSASP